ncbi:AsnC family transcriptional regulator [Burkholderia pseudomallei]|nr:transcriptional regulator, AsnC family [Burkholderia mallei ATCC 23344]ABA51160.1 transcriptional regulator, AsnC family [Burkholderia pseudomallei 1710b]ABM51110.1 transcriptional regulator, AsnC family [Burkholderia mallei SAVP1]ABO05633.1 transcriptional regulator, AsnC family [Burkholderia mallei NCTC 10247]AYE29927.1 Lrp/AsnC family transcriptional regulator [Burkholderia pseudomallei]EES45089.1 transcriptional regulator, AsnC family [Burkholderia mallei PRL-20]EET07400.1 transcriptio
MDKCDNCASKRIITRRIIMLELDHFDLALLDVLQRFGRATHQQLGEEVPLSPSQIGRRLQRLEAAGVIDGYRVVLRPERLGLGVTAFTSLKLKHHGDSIIEQFQQQIDVLPEVLECHAVVGDADYLLRIVAPDLNALSSFVMKKLMRVPGVDSVRSNIVLTTFKRNGPLPLGHLASGAPAA